jgi:membrane-bound lytic murein transglycosylase B
MKKLILIFATAILGLASCQQKTDDKAAIELAKQAAIDSMKMVAQAQEVKQMVIDSMQKATPTTQVTQSAGEGAQSTSAAISGANNSSPAKVEKTSSSSSSSTSTASTPTVTKKKVKCRKLPKEP